MATYNSAATAPFGAIAVLNAVTAFETAVNAVRAWHLRRRTIAELSTLSRAQLSDIGLEGVSYEDIASALRR